MHRSEIAEHIGLYGTYRTRSFRQELVSPQYIAKGRLRSRGVKVRFSRWGRAHRRDRAVPLCVGGEF